MQYLVHIPIAIFNSIILLGLGWVLYKFIEVNLSLKAKSLFIMGSFILCLTTLSFLLDISLVYTVLDLTWFNFQPKLFSTIQLDISNTFFYGIGIFYYVTIIFLWGRMLFQFEKLNKLKINADFSYSEDYKSLLQKFSSLLPTNLKIGISFNVNSPMVFGVTETIVLLPISLCNQLSTQEIKYILLHELAHILRKDYIINILIEMSNVIMWFNPFSYLIIKEIHLQREIDCDRFVIENEKNPIIYAKTLLGIASNTYNYQNSLTIGAIGSNQQLLKRVQKMNGVNNKLISLKTKCGILIIFILLIFIKLNYSSINNPDNIKNFIFIENKQFVKRIKNEVYKNQSILKSDPIKVKSFANTQRKNKPTKHQLPVERINIIHANEMLDNEPSISYADILKQTKDWIKNHQSSALYANYNTAVLNKDSVDNNMANFLLIASIVKSYQLKRTILEKQILKTSNYNEANDYLMNSKEWEDILQYEKWISAFLSSHQ